MAYNSFILPYLCTQTNYIPFVRYCSHYTIADSVVVLLLLTRIYPSHLPLPRPFPFRCSFCFADSSDSGDSAVECLYTTWNKDSTYSSHSNLHSRIEFESENIYFKVRRREWRGKSNPNTINASKVENQNPLRCIANICRPSFRQSLYSLFISFRFRFYGGKIF